MGESCGVLFCTLVLNQNMKRIFLLHASCMDPRCQLIFGKNSTTMIGSWTVLFFLFFFNFFFHLLWGTAATNFLQNACYHVAFLSSSSMYIKEILSCCLLVIYTYIRDTIDVILDTQHFQWNIFFNNFMFKNIIIILKWKILT